MEVMSQQFNLQGGCLPQTNGPLEAERDRGGTPGDKKTDPFYNIRSG